MASHKGPAYFLSVKQTQLLPLEFIIVFEPVLCFFFKNRNSFDNLELSQLIGKHMKCLTSTAFWWITIDESDQLGIMRRVRFRVGMLVLAHVSTFFWQCRLRRYWIVALPSFNACAISSLFYLGLQVRHKPINVGPCWVLTKFEQIVELFSIIIRSVTS
jgi:hypothetical protein